MGAIDIKGTRNLVMYFLETVEELRDNDEKLVATVWNIELRKKNIDSRKVSGFQLLKYFADGNLTNPESIRRSRQKIQENIPELRGHNYKTRKDKDSDVKDELRNFFDDEKQKPTDND